MQVAAGLTARLALLLSSRRQSLPPEELPEAQAELLRMEEGVEKRKKMRRWAGIFGRMMPRSHFATLTTNPSLNSHTTSTTLHWDADRPMTVRESARAQVWRWQRRAPAAARLLCCGAAVRPGSRPLLAHKMRL